MIDENGDQVETTVEDNEDGTYRIRFTAKSVGTHCMKIEIFDRPIKDCPLYFDVTEHNSPVLSFGSRGITETNFVQPCSLILDGNWSGATEDNNLFDSNFFSPQVMTTFTWWTLATAG